MSYRRRIQVEFAHCDPAGIVFYPRYFEMISSVIENFFADILAYPFARIHVDEGCAVPTAHIDIDFSAPSRLGDVLDFDLRIDRVGGASVRFGLGATGGGQDRLQCASTLVWVGRDGRPAPWPQAIRDRMTDFKERDDDA